MLLYIPLTVFFISLNIFFYRYSFPYPIKEYSALFLFLFSFGFIPALLHRIWGRIFLVVGALILVRVGSFSGILVTIPEWTTLHPLFVGAISGITIRELVINRSKPSPERFSFNPELCFLFLLVVLGLERFLAYHPWSFSGGVDTSEGFYYKGLSYRQAFQLSWMVIDNLLLIIYYFFVEYLFSRENENPAKDWIFGLTAAFLIQSLVLLIQNYLVPSAFMQDTAMSLEAGRSAGLFKDSGSASWMYPTMGLFLLWLIWNKKGQMREKFRIAIILCILLLLLANGIKLGRTFYLIYVPSIAVVILSFFWNKKMAESKMGQNAIRLTIILCISVLTFSILWFGENQNALPALKRASIESKQFIRGERKFANIDHRRSSLIASSWELFKESPVFGVGLGSTIVHLKEPGKLVGVKPSDGFVDSPANFYLGWLSEVGILGSVVLIGFVGISVYIRGNAFYLFLLILPFMTGYQIVHSDGAFLVLLLILGTKSINQSRMKLIPKVKRNKIIFTIISVGIALHYLVLSFFKHS